MNKSMSLVWVLVGVLVLGGLLFMGMYNGFVKGSESVDAQWAQVEAQYQRRLDLVPNLVASVQGIMAQEKEVFTALADARTKYAGAQTTNEKAGAATEFESAFARLLVVMENYPQLRSAETVQSLMAELSGTENRVSVERMRYNEMVRDYNISVKTFPGALIAGMFGFSPRTLFEAAEGAETVPQVNL
jgi:LemA protein